MKRRVVNLLAGCALAFFSAGTALALDAFEPDSLTKIAATEKNQPFVLFVWSLDCEYCQASLDLLAQQQRLHKNLKILTLATDRLDDPEASVAVQKKLKAAGIAANAWAFGPASPARLRYAIDPAWRGETPRSYWFNRHGERIAYSGALTPAIFSEMLTRIMR